MSTKKLKTFHFWTCKDTLYSKNRLVYLGHFKGKCFLEALRAYVSFNALTRGDKKWTYAVAADLEHCEKGLSEMSVREIYHHKPDLVTLLYADPKEVMTKEDLKFWQKLTQ